jgi:hypothetical protein
MRSSGYRASVRIDRAVLETAERARTIRLHPVRPATLAPPGRPMRPFFQFGTGLAAAARIIQPAIESRFIQVTHHSRAF